MNIKHIILAAALAIASPAFAETTQDEGASAAAATPISPALPFTAIVHDAATLGMGGTGYASLTGSPTALNPASVAFSSIRMDAAAGVTLWQPSSHSGETFINVGAAFKAGKNFGMTLSFATGLCKPYEITDENGIPDGEFKPSDMQVNLGSGVKFCPWMGMGIRAAYARTKIAPDAAAGSFMTDISLLANFSDFSVSAGVSRLGTKVKASDGTKYGVPASLDLGFAYGRTFAEVHGIDAGLDVSYFFYGAFAASAGAAYTWKDMLSVRAGYSLGVHSPVPSFASAGLGFHISGFHIDAAYLIAPGGSPLANTVCVALGYRF